MGGQPLEVTAEDCNVVKADGMECIYFGEYPIIFVFHTDDVANKVEEGTYVLCDLDTYSYVSYVEFAETIVPIDQMYLPGVTEVFKLQDYGIDLLTMVLGGQTKVEQDNSVLITAVNNAVSAGMIPMVILHEMMPAHCFVNYAYVNGEMGFSGYLRNGEIISRIDVIITNGAVFVFPTVLGA
jgi:hypothetical protein